MTIKIRQTLRNETHLDLFWMKVEAARKGFDFVEPQLPRKRRLPRKLDDDNTEPEFYKPGVCQPQTSTSEHLVS